MKVVQIGGLAGPGGIAGGVWAVAETQAQLLESLGHEVRLLGGWLGKPEADTPVVRLLRLRRPFPGAKLRGLWSPYLARFLKETVLDADIVHVHLSRDFLTTFSLLWLRRRGIPVVVQTHGMVAPGGGLAVRLFDIVFKRLFLTSPVKWLALTRSEHENLKRFGVDESRISSIPNTVRPLVHHWQAPAKPLFVFVSRLHARKQPDVFVMAAIKYLKTGRSGAFKIAGPDQGQLAPLESMISASGYDGEIQVQGALSPDASFALMAGATALVLPSRGEIAPMVVLEAASMGTPIILTADSGLSADFRANDAALVVEPDIDSVAEAMCRLADDATLGASLSVRALALFKARWSQSAMTDVLEHQYATAIAEVKSSRR
jgi:glycosyltransferase involved in cell wall biosynthesis